MRAEALWADERLGWGYDAVVDEPRLTQLDRTKYGDLIP